MPPIIPLTAYKHVPFVSENIQIIGPNITSANALMQIRVKQGDEGSALVTLNKAAQGLQGVSLTYNPAYTYQDASGNAVATTATTVLIQIDETTLEALSFNNPKNSPLTLSYDIHLTKSGDRKRLFCEGQFIIIPGTTYA